MSEPVSSDLSPTSPRPSRRTSATAFAAAAPDADDPLLGFAPYLHPHPRRNSITPAKQRAFIAALAATGIVTQAARSIGVSLEALCKLRRLRGAEGFAAAWEAALDHGVARLEDCALALALESEVTPIVSGGRCWAPGVSQLRLHPLSARPAPLRGDRRAQRVCRAARRSSGRPS